MLNVLSTLDRIAKARSEADLYQVSLHLIRYATPLEIAALIDNQTITNPAFKRWLASLYSDLTQDNSRLAGFKHSLVSSGVSFYSSDGPHESKTLVIGFCTATFDLCAPTALVLQYFSEAEYDVVVVRDTRAVGFTEGIPGYANPLTAAVDRLRVDFRTDSYGEIRCFGVSSGGAAALLAGSLLGATRAISICGQPPTAGPNRQKARGALEMERALRNCATDPTRTVAVFGENHPADAAHARRLAQLVDLTLTPVPDLAEHSILKPLLRRGDLSKFFKSIGLT